MNVVDGYFTWLGKGGAGRIAGGLVLPVVITLGVAAAALNGGGDDPADAITVSSPTAAATVTAPAAAAATSSPAPPQATSTSSAPSVTATAVQVAATNTPVPPLSTATSAAPVQQVVATAVPTQPPPATSTQVPPAVPTATRVPPKATRAAAGGYLPGNAYNCGDFANYAAAKAYFDAVPGDPSQLDSDNDGIPCESLPGAP